MFRFSLRAIGEKFSRAIHTSVNHEAKVALVLSGAGVYDGSEVHEASACWVHLSRAGAEVCMFAPDCDQMHVIDHLKGETMEPGRNVLRESARIARGSVQSLSELQQQQFDALVFPGGFGAAKNLSTFATDGPEMEVNPDVERIIRDFHSAQKPIGLCCIAPVIAARVLSGVSLTVGGSEENNPRWPYAAAAGACGTMGATHVDTDLQECHVDEKNRVVTSAAFMCNAKVHEVFDNVGLMIKAVLALVAK